MSGLQQNAQFCKDVQICTAKWTGCKTFFRNKVNLSSSNSRKVGKVRENPLFILDNIIPTFTVAIPVLQSLLKRPQMLVRLLLLSFIIQSNRTIFMPCYLNRTRLSQIEFLWLNDWKHDHRRPRKLWPEMAAKFFAIRELVCNGWW